MALNGAATANDITVLCDELKSQLSAIAGDEQQQLADLQSSEEDLEQALKNLFPKLTSSKPTKVEKWISKVNRVAQGLYTIIDSAAGLGGPIGNIVWGSVKILLQAASARYDAFEIIFESLVFVADNLPRICMYGHDWPLDLPNPGHRALSDVIKFLTDISKIIASQWKTWTKGLDLSGLKDAQTRLEKSFRSADFENIAQHFKQSQKYQRDARYDALLRQLDLINYEDDLIKRTEARLEDTCIWCKSHPTIQRWLDGTDTRLWLYGKPGAGKSTIAAYMVEQAQKNRSDDEIVLYFFCAANDKDRQTTTSILKAFIVQILRSTDRLLYRNHLEALMDYMLTKSHDYAFSVRNLEWCLSLVLGSFTRLCIIVDGLDECEAPIISGKTHYESTQLIEVLSKLPQPNTRLLFLSRREEHIDTILSTWPAVEVGDIDTTQDDIQKLVSGNVQTLKTAIPSLRDRTDLEQLIMEHADGMFMYVRLLVDTLMASMSSSPAEIDDLLASSPKNLYEMYDKYFIALMERNRHFPTRNIIALRTLQLLVYSISPEAMTTEFLRTMLSINPGDVDFVESRRIADIEAELKQALGMLIDFRPDADGKIVAALVHQSLKDFFTADHSISPSLQHLYNAMQPGSTHLYLLATCCTILGSSSVSETLVVCHKVLTSMNLRCTDKEVLGTEDYLDESQEQEVIQLLQLLEFLGLELPESLRLPVLSSQVGHRLRVYRLVRELKRLSLFIAFNNTHDLLTAFSQLTTEARHRQRLHHMLGDLERRCQYQHCEHVSTRTVDSIPVDSEEPEDERESMEVHVLVWALWRELVRSHEIPNLRARLPLRHVTAWAADSGTFRSHLYEATRGLPLISCLSLVLDNELLRSSNAACSIASQLNSALENLTTDETELDVVVLQLNRDFALQFTDIVFALESLVATLARTVHMQSTSKSRGSSSLIDKIGSLLWWMGIPPLPAVGLSLYMVKLIEGPQTSRDRETLRQAMSALSRLPVIERALKNMASIEFIPGFSVLRHSLPSMAHNISRWIVFVIPPLAADDVIMGLASLSTFNRSNLYTPPKALYSKTYPHGILIFDFELPATSNTFFEILVLALIMGIACPFPPTWVLVALGIFCSEGHRYNFAAHNPDYFAGRMLRAVYSAFLVGQLISTVWSLISFERIVCGIYLMPYFTNIFMFHMDEQTGDVVLEVDLGDNSDKLKDTVGQILMELAATNRAMPLAICCYGLIPLTIFDIASTIVKLVTVQVALDKLSDYLEDPIDFHRALVILHELPHRFEEVNTLLQNARRMELNELNQYWRDGPV